MKHAIKADIYFDGKFWCGRCLDADVFTQGKSLDALVKNLQKTIALHLGKNLKEYHPSIVSLVELPAA